ncbi:MAG: HAMP domain-containing histidine kinase [Gammaproteobacteria bacterium]|nr:HAMP domain-containing histidine kinase [Gammaproteobacteria bacterium]
MSTLSQADLLNIGTHSESGDQSTANGLSHSWQALRIFVFYRFALALFLVWSVYSGKGPSMIASYDRILFSICVMFYAVMLVFSSVSILKYQFEFRTLAFFHLALDLFCLPILIYSSGGIGSGLEALLLMSVAASGLLIGGLYSIGFAALCSLVFLSEAVIADFYNIFQRTHYAEASVLGICSFTVAMIAHSLGRRAESSERLAKERGKDIERLLKLNAYIIQNLQSGVMIIDPVKGIQSVNQSALKFFNLDKTPGVLDDISEQLKQFYQNWLKHSDQDTFELERVDQPPVLSRFIQLDTDDKPYHMVWFEDYSVESKRIQQAKLVSLGHLSASIAHEVRNPLNVISHASQLLEEKQDLDESTRQLSQLIIRHSVRVNRIIENILKLAQRKPANLIAVDINTWILEFINDFQDDFHQYKQRIKVIAKPDNQLILRADLSQLKQILNNLCTNALKHSVNPEECVELEIHCQDAEIHIDILDRGAGIAEQHRDKLFEPFFTTSETGTGLGLYISRELAELNQASLVYLPRSGGGSCFRLTFAMHSQQVISL